MKKEENEVSQEEIDRIWDECEIDEAVLLGGRLAVQGVATPWGYCFVHTHIAPMASQLDLELTQHILDHKCEKSLRFLINNEKGGYSRDL